MIEDVFVSASILLLQVTKLSILKDRGQGQVVLRFCSGVAIHKILSKVLSLVFYQVIALLLGYFCCQLFLLFSSHTFHHMPGSPMESLMIWTAV